MNDEPMQSKQPHARTDRPNPAAEAKKNKPKKPLWVRILLSTLKIICIPAICLIALFVGLWIGYSKMGHQPASEIFRLSTWKHVYDLVFAQ